MGAASIRSRWALGALPSLFLCGALAAAGLGAVSGAEATSPAGTAGETARAAAPTCPPTTVSRGQERRTLRFVLPLCADGFVLSGLEIAPGLPVSGVQPEFAVSGGAADDGLSSCRVAPDGGRVRCFGPVHGNATVRGSFRVRGDRCDADTLFTTSGGVDCDPGVPCPEIARLIRRRVPAPAGCG